jgi:malate dehydrogenase (oxaloacetate-decarboxylating)(NADP+)
VAEATRILKQRNPSLIVDGEMQGSMAFNKEILRDNYPFSELVNEDVNVLMFPNLNIGQCNLQPVERSRAEPMPLARFC